MSEFCLKQVVHLNNLTSAEFLQLYISQLTAVIMQPDFCNELLITVNHFSVYSYCFNYIWRHLKCTAQTLQGVSSPAKCPPILRLL